MMFVEPGSYPGIPGLFASCRVELDGEGNPVITPLVPHPHYEPGPEDEPAPVEEEQKADAQDAPAQPIEQANQEEQAAPQAQPPLSLNV